MQALDLKYMVWIVASVGVIAGLYLLVEISRDSRAKRSEVFQAIREKRIATPETWYSLSKARTMSISFPEVRLSFGEPERAARDPVILSKKTDHSGINVEQERMLLIETIKSGPFTLQYAIENPEFPDQSSAIVDITFVDGYPPHVLTVFPGTRLNEVIPKELLVRLPLMNVEFARISGEGVAILATSPTYSAVRRRALEDNPELEIPDRVEALLTYASQDLTQGVSSGNWRSALSQPLSEEFADRRARGDLPVMRDLPPPQKRGISSNQFHETSVFHESGGAIGSEHMTDAVAEELLDAFEPKIDPQSGEKYLQISTNFPTSESHIARRAGLIGGDRIVSLNSKPVRNASDASALFRSQRDAGVERFVIVLERQGKQITKTYTLRKKQTS